VPGPLAAPAPPSCFSGARMVEPLLRKEQPFDGTSALPPPGRQGAHGAIELEAAQGGLPHGSLLQLLPKGTLRYALYGVSAFSVGLMLLMWAIHNLIAAPDPSTTATSTTTLTFTTVTTTVTTTRPIPLDPAAGEVTFVTAETRGEPMLLKYGRFGGRVLNLGTGTKWDGYETKVKLLRRWLHDQLAAGKGDDLVAFFDGSDVIWGGCELRHFIRAYHRIANRSGAKVVFSAELVCGEQDCNKVPDVPYWAIKIAGGRPLNGGFWKKYVDGCDKTWDDDCSSRRDCGGLAACSVPPSVKFLNSGFVMGPVEDLFRLMDWSMNNYKKYSVWGDQSVFAVYWLKHQEEVTLDYLGELALSLSDMRWDILEKPLHCAKNAEVYLTSSFKNRLRDYHGELNMSDDRKDPLATWILKDAGDGKVFVTSGLGRQLSDEGDKTFGLSLESGDAEKWMISMGGEGHVFLTSSRKSQLQDYQGSVARSPNKQGWESWSITLLDGSPACVEDGFPGGILKNYGFNRRACLIHGNGRGFWFFRHIIKKVTNKTVEELRHWGKHHKLHVPLN